MNYKKAYEILKKCHKQASHSAYFGEYKLAWTQINKGFEVIEQEIKEDARNTIQ